jgi:hypothetical protein
MRKTRTLLAAAAAISGLFALPGPAQAVPPQAEPVEFSLPGSDDVGGEGYCPFPVDVKGVSNQASPDPNGPAVQHFTGFVSVTVTNAETGKSLTFNASGPQTVTFLDPANVGNFPFILDARGPNLLYTTVANSQPAGVPQLSYTKGRVHLETNAAGNTIGYELHGNGGEPTDVCALLAPS